MKITIEGKEFDVSTEKANAVKEMLGITPRQLAEVRVGETYFIGDMEFIKFPNLNGGSVAIMKDIAFESEFNATKDNNFANSTVFKRLKKEILPKIEEMVGKENVLEFETDLFTLDGLDIYGKMRSKISLPTFDYHRANRPIFDKFKLDVWWWLATANSNNWITCVSPSGFISDLNYNSHGGVRPFLIFDPNIFVS